MTQKTSKYRVAERLQGVKEYYFSRKLAEVAQRRLQGQDILNLGIGNPDLPPPPGVISALREDLQQPGAHGYQSYRGTAQLRAAYQAWYRDVYQVQLTDDEVLPLAGTKEGIAHLCLAYLQTGDVVLAPDPGYPAYSSAAKLAGARSLAYALPSPGDSEGQWLKNLTDLPGFEAARLMFVNTPHMPTGQCLSRGQLEQLTAFAKTHGLLLISDNAYNYYAPGGPQSMLTIPGARSVCVELNSLSKSHHLAGWRQGVLVGQPEVLQRALQVKSNLDSGQFRPLQRGASAALSTPPNWHNQRNELIAERREFATQLLVAMGLRVAPGQAGLFVWAEGTEVEASDYTDGLLDKAKVFLAPGTVFGPRGAGCVRLSLCSPLTTLQLAAERLEQAGFITQKPQP